MAEPARIVIRLTAKTVAARAHEMRRAECTLALAREQGREVVVTVQARGRRRNA